MTSGVLPSDGPDVRVSAKYITIMNLLVYLMYFICTNNSDM